MPCSHHKNLYCRKSCGNYLQKKLKKWVQDLQARSIVHPQESFRGITSFSCGFLVCRVWSSSASLDTDFPGLRDSNCLGPKAQFRSYVPFRYPACFCKSNNNHKQKGGRSIFQLFNYAPITERNLSSLLRQRVWRMSPAALTTGKFKVLVGNIIHLKRQFSTAVPRQFLKHEIPDSLVRGTDLFSLVK